MPPVVQYVPPNDPTRNSQFNTVNERLIRNQSYQKALDYYEGKQTKYLDRKEGEPDDNIVVNMFAEVVDRTISFLFPDMPTFKTDLADNAANPQEIWLKNCLEFSGGLGLMHEAGTNGSLAGHVFMKLYPAKQGQKYPTVFTLDPRTVTVYWDYRDIRNIVWIEIFWSAAFTLDGTATELSQAPTQYNEFLQDIVFDPATNTWKIFDYSRPAGILTNPVVEGGWKVMAADTWDYPFAPVVHWKHGVNPNSFYGRGEGTHLYLGDKVNLIWSEVARIIRYYAGPKTVGIGVDADDVQETALDGFYGVPAGSDVKNLEMHSDLASSQKAAEYFHDAYLAQSRVVVLKGSIKDFQRVTDSSIRTLFLDMILKSKVLKSHYGGGLREVARRLLVIGGQGDYDVDIVWPDPLPVDKAQQVLNAQVERSMNVVSRETVSESLGHNWKDEKSKIEDESKDAVFNPVQQNPGPNTGQDQPLDKQNK